MVRLTFETLLETRCEARFGRPAKCHQMSLPNQCRGLADRHKLKSYIPNSYANRRLRQTDKTDIILPRFRYLLLTI